MRLIYSLALFIAGAGAQAATLPTPAQALQQATQSRVAFINTVTVIERFAPTMTQKEQVYSYINILDQLQVIGKRFDIDSFGATPLRSLANVLTLSAVKWVSFKDDTLNDLGNILRWSESWTRFEIAKSQQGLIVTTGDKAGLLLWIERSQAVLELLKNLERDSSVLYALSTVQSVSLLKLLKLYPDFSSLELKNLMALINTPAALDELAAFIRAHLFTSTESSKLLKDLEWSLVLSNRVSQLSSELLPSQISGASSLLLETLRRIILTKNSVSEDLAREAVRSLSEYDAVSLARELSAFEFETLDSSQVNFVYALATELSKQVGDKLSSEERKRFASAIGRLALSIRNESENFEGVYEIKVGQRKGLMTIANAGSSYFIVAVKLNDALYPSTYINYALFNMTFDPQKNRFEAHRYAVDSLINPVPLKNPYYLNFSIAADSGKPDLNIEGEFSNSIRQKETLKGKRISRLPSLAEIKGTKPDVDSLSFEGSFQDMRCQLVISRVGSRLAGVLSCRWENDALGSYHIPLEYGFINPLSHSIYLTTGELDSGTWVQIRGRISDDGQFFRGFRIVGARNEVAEINFKRSPQ